MLPIIKSFSGHPKNLYLHFCKVFSSVENLYINFSGNCSFEVANHLEVPAYNKDDAENYSENDLSLISYLDDSVFGTFYKKICCSTKTISLYSKVCLSFLMAGNWVGENFTLPELKHVNIIDLDGLWRVNENAGNQVAEKNNCQSYFKKFKVVFLENNRVQ